MSVRQPPGAYRVSAAELAAVAIASFAVLLLGMSRDVGVFDEGIILSGAMRVLAGQVLHRDFYSLYGPAQYYITAAALHASHHPLLAARLWDVAVRAATLTTLFAVIRPFVPAFMALVTTAIGGVWLLGVGNYLYPIFPCIPLAMIATALIARFTAGRAGRLAMFAAGACTGAAALFRYDVGFYLAVANALTLLILGALAPSPRPPWRRLLSAVIFYALGCALIFGPPAIAYLRVASPGAFLEDVVRFPLRYYAGTRDRPFPRWHDLLADPAQAIVYVPLMATVLGGAELLRRLARRDAGLSLAAVHLAAFAITATVLFQTGVVRVSPVHMVLSIMPALAALTLAARLWPPRGLAFTIPVALVSLAVLLPTLSEAGQYLAASRRAPDHTTAGWLAARMGLLTPAAMLPPGCGLAPPLRFGFLPPDLALVANYLAAHSGPGEKILVATGRHDKIFANIMALYFAAFRLPSTHWSQYDPGLQTRADIQQAMIADLQRDHTRWVVRNTTFDNYSEPNLSSVSSGVTLLDQYLATHYRPVAQAGAYAVWLIDSAPAPAAPPNPCEAPKRP